MQQVQSCSWGSFKLNEIVTLERCLQEVMKDNPAMRSLINKLANEAVFVEPVKKIDYLNRGKTKMRKDREATQEVKKLEQEIKRIDQELDRFKAIYSDIKEGEDDTHREIRELKSAVVSANRINEVHLENCGYALEQVQTSFEFAKEVCNKIPDFLEEIRNSELMKVYSPIDHKNFITRLIKENISRLEYVPQQRQQEQIVQFSYRVKSNLLQQLQDYSSLIAKLHQDLLLVESLNLSELKGLQRSLEDINSNCS